MRGAGNGPRARGPPLPTEQQPRAQIDRERRNAVEGDMDRREQDRRQDDRKERSVRLERVVERPPEERFLGERSEDRERHGRGHERLRRRSAGGDGGRRNAHEPDPEREDGSAGAPARRNEQTRDEDAGVDRGQRGDAWHRRQRDQPKPEPDQRCRRDAHEERDEEALHGAAAARQRGGGRRSARPHAITLKPTSSMIGGSNGRWFPATNSTLSRCVPGEMFGTF